MVATPYNILIPRNATYQLAITWEDNSNNVYNLLGYTADLQFRGRPGSVLLFELSTSNGRITLGSSAPNISLYIDKADTQFMWDSAYYDLVLTAPNGTATRLIEGQVIILPDITQ